MSFYKQPGFIFQDGLGSLHNFVWSNGKIILTRFEKNSDKKEKKTLIDNATIEFDITNNSLDEIYLLWKNIDGSINLIMNQEEKWNNTVLIDPNSFRILNLNIIEIDKVIHIVYCLGSNEDENTYKICHQYFNEGKWLESEVGEIKAKQILNPINIFKHENQLTLGYYDLINGTEQIFIKVFNNEKHKWKESIQLTNTPNQKLYLDMLVMEDHLHITYSEYKNRNFIVKYEKYRYIDENISKLTEKEVSNPANCTYPTLIFYENKLWNVWNEFNYLASRYSTNKGEDWSPLYIWKDSKFTNYLRYRFIQSQEYINDYKFNYSFARVEDLSFIGFGNLEDAIEAPIKKKRGGVDMINSDENKEAKSIDIDNNPSYDLEKLKYDIEKLDKEVTKIVNDLESKTVGISEIKEKLNNLDEKIEEIKGIDERTEKIEKFLLRKSRSFKKQK